MGIFDTEKNISSSNSTKGFYFGAPEAEAENKCGHRLTDYFDDYLDILRHLENGKFIFVGRKGVGKSAISKFIKDKSDATDDSFAKLLRLSDFMSEKSVQSDTEKDSQLFEWLILVNLVKLIVKNKCGAYTFEYDKLQKFLDKNAGVVEVDKFQIIEGNKREGFEVNFGMLAHTFGGVINKYFDLRVTKAPFYKIIQPLKEIVKIILDYEVNKSKEFWLLFDDLDVNFNIYNELDKLKIMELIRIARNYNNEIFTANKAKILIFLREDVRKRIISEYPDSAKIFNSYEIPINWYNYTESLGDENKTAIKRMINKRIELNFKNRNIAFGYDPWYTLFNSENYSQNVYKKSSFKYILDFTFYRPRDIITILNVVSDIGFIYPISKSDVKTILEVYIKKNIDEIKSELSLFFDETDKGKLFTSLFKYLSEHPRIPFLSLMNKIEQLKFKIDSKTVFDLLLAYSFIVAINVNGDYLFNYRESSDFDKEKMEALYFNLPKNIFHYYKPFL